MLTDGLQFPLAFFFNPWFFWAGAGLVSLPILIHILNRRRFKIVHWAAMEYLLQAMRKNRRRLKFEQWILLAARCLIMVLIGAALARPLGCREQSMAGMLGQNTGMHVLIVDNSYSMAYESSRSGSRTHLEQAKSLARALVDRMTSGSESVVLITASRPATAVVAAPDYDLNGVRGAIERIEQSSGGTDMDGALKLAAKIARAAKEPPRNLHIFSDATQSSLPESTRGGVDQSARELARTFEIYYHNLGGASQWNHAVLSVEPETSVVTSKEAFARPFVASVLGYGEAREGTVEWKFNEVPVPNAGTSARLSAETRPFIGAITPRNRGAQVITVTVAGSEDRLLMDNVRNRVVDVVADVKVLLVEGARGPSALDGSAAFLESALAPPKEATTQPGDSGPSHSYLAPRTISDWELGNNIRPEYRAIFLTNIESIQAAQADALKAWVENGGLLFIFAGDKVQSRNYNEILAPRKLMPGVITKRVDCGERPPFVFDFNPEAIKHPLLKVFEHESRSGLNTAQVWTYLQVEPTAGLPVQRVLDYRQPEGQPVDDKAGKDPAITLHPLGKGKVLFVSTSAGPEWTSLPAKKAYVALVQELVLGGFASSDRWMNLAVGDRLAVPPEITADKFTLVDPYGAALPMEAETIDDRPVYRSPVLTRAGLYKLSAGTGRDVMPIAVNVPDDEADVRVMEEGALRSALGNVKLNYERDTLAAIDQIRRSQKDFGWTVMVALLALLALECYMAMRFGHHRNTSTRAAAQVKAA